MNIKCNIIRNLDCDNGMEIYLYLSGVDMRSYRHVLL